MEYVDLLRHEFIFKYGIYGFTQTSVYLQIWIMWTYILNIGFSKYGVYLQIWNMWIYSDTSLSSNMEYVDLLRHEFIFKYGICGFTQTRVYLQIWNMWIYSDMTLSSNMEYVDLLRPELIPEIQVLDVRLTGNTCTLYIPFLKCINNLFQTSGPSCSKHR